MNEDKIKIVFFTANLEAGGAERVMINIFRNLDRSRFIPVLYLFNKQGSLLPLVPKDMEIFTFDEPHIYGFKMIILLQRVISHLKQINPHILLSFMWYPNAVAILAKMFINRDIKIVASERTSTSIYSSRLDHYLRNSVIRFLYPRANAVISPSRGIAQGLASKSVQEKKLRIIQNPVDIDMICERASENLDHFWYKGRQNIVTAIGRLGDEKGFDYLIKAFAILKRSSIDSKLVIVGEGRERNNLEKLIAELQLGERVKLAGFQENPYKYLARSTVFVLSSLYEGFPNVLLEAMALGVPSVATRCPTGPDEIITEGVDGILVPSADEKALAGAIKRLVMDEDLRKRLGDAGRKRAQDFAVEKIVKQYEDAIESVCAESAER